MIVQRLIVCFGSLLLIASQVNADDWPQFLGNDRNGISNESGLIQDWPDDGPKIAWRSKIGTGMSGCSIVGDKLVSMGQDDAGQYVICLNSKDGKEVWKTKISSSYSNEQGHGPRSTPTIDSGFVYAYSGDGKLAKLDLENGRPQWQINVPVKFYGRINDYGVACSPLVTNGQVIVTIDSIDRKNTDQLAELKRLKAASLRRVLNDEDNTPATFATSSTVAVSAKSGEPIWTGVLLNREEVAGYSSPMLINYKGNPHAAILTGNHFFLFDILGEGRLVATKKFETDYGCNTANPVILNNEQIFISAGENHGAELLDLTSFKDKKGAILKPVWESLGPKSVMRNEWQTSIRIGDHLYGLDNQGSAGTITNLACINWKTGEQLWKVPRFGKANMVYANDRCWMSNMDGEMIFGKLSVERFEKLGQMKVVDTTRQAPSISNGFLYFRGSDEVVCVDVRKSTYQK